MMRDAFGFFGFCLVVLALAFALQLCDGERYRACRDRGCGDMYCSHTEAVCPP